jgi:hypothetical protein
MAANAWVIGTVEIVAGFIWMIGQNLAPGGVDFSLTLIAFFFTIFGIVFWGFGYALGKKKEPVTPSDETPKVNTDVAQEPKVDNVEIEKEDKPTDDSEAENDNFGETIIQ